MKTCSRTAASSSPPVSSRSTASKPTCGASASSGCLSVSATSARPQRKRTSKLDGAKGLDEAMRVPSSRRADFSTNGRRRRTMSRHQGRGRGEHRRAAPLPVCPNAVRALTTCLRISLISEQQNECADEHRVRGRRARSTCLGCGRDFRSADWRLPQQRDHRLGDGPCRSDTWSMARRIDARSSPTMLPATVKSMRGASSWESRRPCRWSPPSERAHIPGPQPDAPP